MKCAEVNCPQDIQVRLDWRPRQGANKDPKGEHRAQRWLGDWFCKPCGKSMVAKLLRAGYRVKVDGVLIPLPRSNYQAKTGKRSR